MGCAYRKEDNCRISGITCPWAYWCDRHLEWKENAESKSCRLQNRQEMTPHGYCAVEFERHGKLYVAVDKDTVVPIKNPYDTIPMFVKVRKNGGYKITGRWTGN